MIYKLYIIDDVNLDKDVLGVTKDYGQYCTLLHEKIVEYDVEINVEYLKLVNEVTIGCSYVMVHKNYKWISNVFSICNIDMKVMIESEYQGHYIYLLFDCDDNKVETMKRLLEG